MIVFESIAIWSPCCLMLSHLIERIPVQRGVLLGIAAGLGFGISDVAIKALSGDLDGGIGGLLSPWSAVIVTAAVFSFYASARSLQIGDGVAVIAVTSVAANLSTIVLAVFGDQLGNDPFVIGVFVTAFALILTGAALIPAPTRRRSAPRGGPGTRPTAGDSCPERGHRRPSKPAGRLAPRVVPRLDRDAAGVASGLQRRDVELGHLEHRLHGAGGAFRVAGEELVHALRQRSATRARSGPCSQTCSEMASSKVNCGPPLMATMRCPSSSNSTTIAVPALDCRRRCAGRAHGRAASAERASARRGRRPAARPRSRRGRRARL